MPAAAAVLAVVVEAVVAEPTAVGEIAAAKNKFFDKS